MEHYVYIRERRRGARLVKTPYQGIKFWVHASGAVREAVPIFKGTQVMQGLQPRHLRLKSSHPNFLQSALRYLADGHQKTGTRPDS